MFILHAVRGAMFIALPLFLALVIVGWCTVFLNPPFSYFLFLFLLAPLSHTRRGSVFPFV